MFQVVFFLKFLFKYSCLHFPPITPPTSPLVTVSLFLISMSLVVFWLLVCFID